MKRVTGLGGVFAKCSDPEAMKTWYRDHLGIASDQYGGMFRWRDPEKPDKECLTTGSPFLDSTKYFAPSTKEWMLNYRVEDLDALLEILKTEGVQVVGEVESYEYGKFGWILDPEANKIELWEPLDEPLLKRKPVEP